MVKPLVAVTGLWKSLGGRIVLRGVSLSIEEGERIALLGDNGSGKSTVLYALCGVLEPDGGTIVSRDGATIGFAPEKPDLPEHLLVGEWLDVVASLKGLRSSRLEDSAAFGVDELRNKATKALSLGQKQRVSLAAASMGNPSLVVLDEPTNALDSTTRRSVIERLRTSAAAIIATHDHDIATEVATRVLEIRGGVLRPDEHHDAGKNEHRTG